MKKKQNKTKQNKAKKNKINKYNTNTVKNTLQHRQLALSAVLILEALLQCWEVFDIENPSYLIILHASTHSSQTC